MSASAPPRRRRWRWVPVLVFAPFLCCGAVTGYILLADRLAPPASEADLRADLAAKLDETRAVWTALDSLWGRLEVGESVYCDEESVAHPYFIAWRASEQDAYPALAAIANDLNGAIRGLHRAADAWTDVCQGGAVGIPAETAQSARAALTRAAAALDAVEAALSAQP